MFSTDLTSGRMTISSDRRNLGGAAACSATTPIARYAWPGGGLKRRAKPHDFMHDRISNARSNETRALRLIPALRVNSGTDRTEDRRSRFSASRNCAERDTFRPAIRTQNFHHHGPSGGRSEPSSGPRNSLCWSKDPTQKTALVTTSALPATTNTSPRITIAVLPCCHQLDQSTKATSAVCRGD
jgi:hypothetical protein